MIGINMPVSVRNPRQDVLLGAEIAFGGQSMSPSRFYSPRRAFLTIVRTDARHRSDQLFV
jgi:hypothetical protein